MRVLTDCPDETAALLGPTQWSRAHASDLPSAEGEIWRALAGPAELAVTDLTDPSPTPFWALTTIRREAPRSQYDALHEALGRGLELSGPTACVALAGRGFHGQRGRPWKAEPGNLFLAVGLAPRAPIKHLVPALTMLPVVAVVDAIDHAGGPGVRAGIKWVNDVMIGERKVGGVLAATHVRGATVETAVLGIGVNVVHAPGLEPTPFVPEAGCLRGAGIAVDLGGFLLGVLERLAHRYRELLARGQGPLLEAYRARSVVLGRRVRLCEEGQEPDGPGEPGAALVGVVRSIEPDLALRLEGHAEPVRRGRLLLEPVIDREPATGGSAGRSRP